MPWTCLLRNAKYKSTSSSIHLKRSSFGLWDNPVGEGKCQCYWRVEVVHVLEMYTVPPSPQWHPSIQIHGYDHLFPCSGRNIYEQSWSQGENTGRAEAMACWWLGSDHPAKAGNSRLVSLNWSPLFNKVTFSEVWDTSDVQVVFFIVASLIFASLCVWFTSLIFFCSSFIYRPRRMLTPFWRIMPTTRSREETQTTSEGADVATGFSGCLCNELPFRRANVTFPVHRGGVSPVCFWVISTSSQVSSSPLAGFVAI